MALPRVFYCHKIMLPSIHAKYSTVSTACKDFSQGYRGIKAADRQDLSRHVRDHSRIFVCGKYLFAIDIGFCTVSAVFQQIGILSEILLVAALVP